MESVEDYMIQLVFTTFLTNFFVKTNNLYLFNNRLSQYNNMLQLSVFQIPLDLFCKSGNNYKTQVSHHKI